MSNNTWKSFREYINKKEVGTSISRKEIKMNIKHYGYFTLDTYKRILEAVGCLETEKRGQYKIIMKVPDLPYNIMRDLAYITLGGNKIGR